MQNKRLRTHYTPYDPNDPSNPVIFSWHGGALDLSLASDKDPVQSIIRGFKKMLGFFRTFRAVELNGVHYLSPEWIRVTRLKDFPLLRELRIIHCFPFVLDEFDVTTEYHHSILDLSVGDDTHFTIDFYPYDARLESDWNQNGECASRSNFEKIFPFFLRSHAFLLRRGYLLNTALTEMILPFSSFSNAPKAFHYLDAWDHTSRQKLISTAIEEGARELENPQNTFAMGASTQNNLMSSIDPYDSDFDGESDTSDAIEIALYDNCYSQTVSIVDGKPANPKIPGNRHRLFTCDMCEGKFRGYCFRKVHIHGNKKDFKKRGGCARDEVWRSHWA
ncbi:uncharacterized protein KD926_001705 [Aspergillus affinis]|uniref:uncharacterized protein n=1 Tax=Aspergillus affinis TaxID=1070780 RepID=UPI0022FECC94|nr:uncharacterized protein KD926_001705 [Aspergillus affinis]KAI9036568.1 hypothetical protein KD926_001705 [Aspergillus affinis]